MTRTRAALPAPEGTSVGEAARYAATHARQVFLTDWNWKTALLSAAFRMAVWPATKLTGARLVAAGSLRGMAIEFVFRLAIGGFWGSLLQAFATAQPAWLAGLLMVGILPAGAHGLEYAVLRAGGATRAGAVTVVSAAFSALSFAVNWALMRKGILMTSRGGASLGTDLRRIFGMAGRGPCPGDSLGDA
ncbi:MAG TPA: hypothetical protein VMU19_05415 [Bryobacteraceae bacterium]|nr:hypothetical protein [Bryobacteraceae bacterium]